MRFKHFLLVIIQKQLYCTLAILHKYFTLNLFTVQVVIIKIWMDNWRMGLAKLE